MSGAGYTVEMEGAEEFVRMLKHSPQVAKKHFKNAMRKSVSTIELNVKDEAPTGVSARLAGSIASEVKGVGSNIIGEVGSTLKDEEYPAVMEFGRKAGAKMPPPSALERWVHIVLKVPNKHAKGVAYIVARAIGKKGIEGKRYFEKGFNKSKSQIDRNFGQALDYVMREMSKK